MQTLKTAAMVLGMAAAIGAAQANEACAEYGAVKIRNTSNATIYYQFKWGADSEWQSSSVRPGHYMCHWIELDEHGQAPVPYIRFDARGGDGDVTWQSYRLGFYATHSTCGGKSYSFRYYGRYIDLLAH